MIFEFLRKSYVKLTQIWDEHEKEMREWAQQDLEELWFRFHYCRFVSEVT